jgi:chromosome segregation ATPase
LREKISALETELEGKNQVMKDLVEAHYVLEKGSKTQSEVIADLEHELDSSRATVEETEELSEALEADIVRLKEAVANGLARNKELEDQLAARIANDESTSSSAAAAVAALSAERASASAAAMLSVERDGFKEERDTYKEERDKYKEENDKYKVENDNYKEEIVRLQTELQVLTSKIQVTEEMCTESQSKTKSLIDELNRCHIL